MTKPTMALVVTGASPARHLGTLTAQLGEHGWNVQVQTTQTARPLFGQERPPDLSTSDGIDPQTWPELVLVAPATFHWISALAAGINDTAALQIVQPQPRIRARVRVSARR